MEELMDFISELHERDRIRAAKEEGRIVGRIECLEDFLSANPNGLGMSCGKIATILKVDERLVKSLMRASE